MSSPMANRIHIPKPPPLSWKVVCQLAHLSNAEKVPLPLILAASRDEDALLGDDDHAFEGDTDRERFSMMRRDAGRKSPTVPVAPARGAAVGHGNSKFFTISKKGRTLADFSRRESFQQPRGEGDRESTSDRQVPLPSYLVNPYTTVLFEKPKTGGHDGGVPRRRKSDVRRRSSAGASHDAAGSREGFLLEAVVNDEPPLAYFTPSTYSRQGTLNVAQMRVLEKISSSREAANRRALEAVHLKEAAAGGDSWALAVVGTMTQGATEKTSPRASKSSPARTPVTVSQSLPQLQLPSPRAPTTPRAMLKILHRQQVLTVNLNAFQSQIVRPTHGLHGTPELIDWQLPPVPTKAVQPLEAQSAAQCHVVDINQVVTPPPPSVSPRVRQCMSSPSDDVSPLTGFPVRESPSRKSPSPRRASQNPIGPKHSKAPSPRDPASDGRGMKVIVDEKTGTVSYKPNPLRELGSEVSFH